MNKKVLYFLIAIAVISIIVVGVIFLTKNNETKTLEKLNISLSEKSPFNEMATMNITTEELNMLLEINQEDINGVIGKVPLTNVQASMYLVIEAKEGKVDTVKEKVEAYAQAQETQWERYLPEQYALVQQRKLGVVGNYVYLVIAETANELEELIIK